MESLAELIVTLLFAPFESKFDDADRKIKRNPRKGLRIFLRILLYAALIAILGGVYLALYFLFQGR